MSRGFMIDMDGVIYRGSELIPGAQRFVHLLLRDDIPFLFLTNNSQRKPSPVMMRAARKELSLSADETTMIGDTMETDILGGVQMGYRTVLVLSGSTQKEDLGNYAYRPDCVVDSVADLCSVPFIANGA